MAAQLRFVKLVGAGNDFIFLDADSKELPPDLPGFARTVCRARMSIGADGVVVIKTLDGGHFRMRLVNPDGSEATTCGNAIRCAALYTKYLHGVSEPTIHMHNVRYEVAPDEGGFSSSFGEPHSFRGPVSIGAYDVFYLHTGTDHVVAYVPSVEEVPVQRDGALICHHAAFQPSGTNVNFVTVVDDGTLQARTYERGVEAETLSCGSGAVAAAVISRHLQKVRTDRIRVMNRTTTPLMVILGGTSMPFSPIRLSGPAALAFEGTIAWS